MNKGLDQFFALEIYHQIQVAAYIGRLDIREFL